MIDEKELMGEYSHNLHIDWVNNWRKNGFKSQDDAIECVGKSIASKRDFRSKMDELKKKLELKFGY